MKSKTIIYLDQNFISDIAKFDLADKKDKVRPALRAVFDAIKAGVDEEKFLSPDGWIHAIETAAESNPELRSAIGSYQAYLGQTSLNPPWEIKSSQFVNALLAYCGIQSDERETWRTAFRENPNRRMENFRITVSMPDLGLGGLSDNSLASLQKIRESGVKAETQYQAEIIATRKHYKMLIRTDYKYELSRHGVSVERAEEFIDSEAFAEVPNIDIFCRLWSRSLADKERKRGIEGDYNDIEFLSVYLPYCAVIATDHYMKTTVVSLGLDKKYGCLVFSMKEDDLGKMLKFLDEERAKKVPASTSLFSILCVMAKSKPVYEVSFLKKLSLARNKFQRTGKYWNKDVYVEVFLVYEKSTKIKMPNSEEVLKHGPHAMNAAQWSEMLVFGSNFEKIYNLDGKKVEKVIGGIPAHLRGPATAILRDDSDFDADVPEHDSFLFYDIENAVEKKLAQSERYMIPIVYN